eukprot:CAMPEP_0203666070 /NCGR_PEP_ID=MMETSP0090-20130426/3185_1 /ASSEMBLY_ACC=CAM_ASM_001088 /TAXON_ID=426623 /ORGANISM="Chaetoceros affinis, Strain CCMP159" /LENGTH=289 /DNA_ID=CAMNT_0050529853 /DNA_START=18 /DNA_END=884 /DNA_ORIENTATION=+
MNVIKEINQINKVELENGSVNTPASWHAKYANSAWVYVGNLATRLSEGDILCVMSQFGEIEDIHLVRDDGNSNKSGKKDGDSNSSNNRGDEGNANSKSSGDSGGGGGGTGKSKGFAFVKYEDARSCILAVDNFNGSKILSRSMRVDHVENYRLPKHLQEKEEDGKFDKAKLGGAGHAYEGKELKNGFDIHQGQDLFAPVSSSQPKGGEEEDEWRRLREEKKARKLDREKKRQEKAARKEEREEKRRLKRARKTTKRKSSKKHSKRPKSDEKSNPRERHDSSDDGNSHSE